MKTLNSSKCGLTLDNFIATCVFQILQFTLEQLNFIKHLFLAHLSSKTTISQLHKLQIQIWAHLKIKWDILQQETH